MPEEYPQCPLATKYATDESLKADVRPFTALSGDMLERLHILRKWPVGDEGCDPIPLKLPDTVRQFHYDVLTRSLTDTPLVVKEFQKQAIQHLIRMPRFILGDAVGLGKAQPLEAGVLTPNGWTTMGALAVGDAVVDPDTGGAAYVEGVFPQGEKDIYRVFTKDGAFTECCGEHLWTVQTPDDRMRGNYRTLTTKEILSSGLYSVRPSTGDKISRFFLPLPAPVRFNFHGNLPIPAYTMGILLGDGCIRNSVFFSSADPQIQEAIAELLPVNLHIRKCKGENVDWAITTGCSGAPNTYIRALKSLGIFGKFSYEKNIPESYLQASISERKKLLWGLMDSDGECSKSGLSYFSTTSKMLAEGIATLVRSLGGIAAIRFRKPKYYTYKEQKRLGRAGFTVTVKTTFNPFNLQRKAIRWKPALQARAISKIEYIGRKAAQCIRVSSKRHLYITDGYIVTHNTLDSLVAFAWLKARNPKAKMVVVTTKSMTYQWSDECEKFTTLRPMVMADAYHGLKGSNARYAQFRDFLEKDDHDILVAKYDSLKGLRKKHKEDGVWKRQKESEETTFYKGMVRDHSHNVVLCLDECHRFRKTGTQTRHFIQRLCWHGCPERVWALTATAIKNGLDEFYSVAVAIGVQPLGSMTQFWDEYCLWRKQHVGNGREISIITGYQNVAHFKEQLRPFFLGRSQKQVKEKLPALSTIYHPIDLDEKQAKLLVEIPLGLIELPPIMLKVAGEVFLKERDPSNEMAQPMDSKILTPFGWKLMGEMAVGDAIIDPDTGMPAVVEGVFPQGTKDVYRLTTKSGAVAECTEDHLWLVQDYFNRYTSQRHKDKWTVRTTSEVLKRGLVYHGGKWDKYKHFLPVSRPVQFASEAALPVPSYTLGVLLGDGSLTCTVKFSAHAVGKEEIIKYVQDELPASLKVHSVPRSRYHLISVADGKRNANAYLKAVRQLGIYGLTASEKFIPDLYLHSSIQERKNLLAGLMDSDGCCTQEGHSVFTVTSRKLAKGVVELVRSLGGIASLRGPYKSTKPNRLGVWTVRFRTEFNPFRMSRKVKLWKYVELVNPIVSIRRVGRKPCQCIRTSAKRSLYITDQYIVTHNTQLSCQQLVANHWALIDRNNPETFLTPTLSPKEDALLDMLDGEYRGEKVVVYAQPLDAKISTPHGWRLMADIVVGERVSDPDGGTAVVEDIYPQGKKPIYRITTKSGAVTECSEDHLWTIQTYTDKNKRTGKWRTYPLKKMLQKPCLRTNKNGSQHYRYFLPIPEPVEFPAVSLPLSPYVVGVLLGDGDITRSATFCSADEEIIARVRQEIPTSTIVVPYRGINYGITTTLPHPKDARGFNAPGANEVVNTLRSLKLLGMGCQQKRIPPSYLRSSVEQRMSLLRGLMDTDGTIGDNNQPRFTSVSYGLACDVAEMVRSLGGLATVLGPYPSHYTRDGKRKRVLDHWQVNIRTRANPFNLSRKAAKWAFADVTNPVKSIEFVGYKDCQCIRVSSKRSLYLTDDYICTHNTKYRSWIDRLERLTKDGKFTERRFLRITGAESEAQRNANKRLFQNPDSGYDLIVVNAAGMEGINLQQAAHMVMLDCPWSWGDLIQLVGRMVRMASPHSACTLHIMVAKGTIDEYAIDTLRGKKGVFEAILGNSHSAGILDSGDSLDLQAGMEVAGSDAEFKSLLKAYAKKIGMKTYLKGDEVKAAQELEYQMSFEREPKQRKRRKEQDDSWTL